MCLCQAEFIEITINEEPPRLHLVIKLTDAEGYTVISGRIPLEDLKAALAKV